MKIKVSKFDEIIMRALVRKLPEDIQELIIMRFWDYRTLEDIAETLGMSVREVEKGLDRAMASLRQMCLEQPAFSSWNLFLSKEEELEESKEVASVLEFKIA